MRSIEAVRITTLQNVAGDYVFRPTPAGRGNSEEQREQKTQKANLLGWLNDSTGAADRNRTGDLRITNALLYQLSYSGVQGRALYDSHHLLQMLARIFERKSAAKDGTRLNSAVPASISPTGGSSRNTCESRQ